MLEDAFLLKWLLEKDFDVKQAAGILRQNLKWRADQNMDSIMEENWNDMKSILPYSMNNTDKFGRPLIYLDFGKWDIAKLVSEQLPGKDRLERFLYMFGEESEQDIRDLQANGQNVTQDVIIINVDNFSLEKHGCIQCLLFYRKVTQTLAENFPWTAERNLLVNVPYMFEVVNAYVNDNTKRYMNVLGRDKSTWEATILQTIDRDQLPSGLLEQQTKIF